MVTGSRHALGLPNNVLACSDQRGDTVHFIFSSPKVLVCLGYSSNVSSLLFCNDVTYCRHDAEYSRCGRCDQEIWNQEWQANIGRFRDCVLQTNSHVQ